MMRGLLDRLLPRGSLIRAPVLRLMRNSGTLMAGGILTTALATLGAVLLARYLGPNKFGELALALAPVALVYQLVDFRTWEILLGFLPSRTDVASVPRPIGLSGSLILLDAAIGVAGSAAIVLAALVVSRASEVDESVRLTQWASLSLPATLVAAGVPIGTLRASENFKIITAKNSVVASFYLLLILVVVTRTMGVAEVVLAYIATQFLDAVVGIGLTCRVMRVGPVSLLRQGAREFMGTFRLIRGFAGHSWLTGTIKAASGQADILLLGYLAHPAAVGTYRLALEITNLLSKIGNPVVSAVLPLFMEDSVRSNHRLSRSIAYSISVALTSVVLPAVILLVLYSPMIALVAGGRSFVGAADLIAVLALGTGLGVILTWARPMLISQSRIGTANTAAILGAVIGLALLVALASVYGALGAAIGTSVRVVLTAVTMTAMALTYSYAHD